MTGFIGNRTVSAGSADWDRTLREEAVLCIWLVWERQVCPFLSQQGVCSPSICGRITFHSTSVALYSTTATEPAAFSDGSFPVPQEKAHVLPHNFLPHMGGWVGERERPLLPVKQSPSNSWVT